jgi:catechol 2,3-dioxygenase
MVADGMSQATPETQIAAETTVGPVHLTVADLARSIDYYRNAIGLEVLSQDGSTASLGTAGNELLVLYEEPGAEPVQGHTGLFHFAILLPDRLDLARWLAHAAQDRIPLSGASDHLVSEALYLRDPDGHGIEIYRDRPRSEWPLENDGGVRMATLPLDLDAILASLDDGAEPGAYAGMPAGTRMGHVHLHVRDVDEAERFYRDVLGFDLMAHLGAQATFLSAGGYHHHIGGNTWAGQGATPPPPGSAALRHATIVLPDAGELDRVAGRVADGGQEPEAADGGVMVRDPSQNAWLLTPRHS